MRRALAYIGLTVLVTSFVACSPTEGGRDAPLDEGPLSDVSAPPDTAEADAISEDGAAVDSGAGGCSAALPLECAYRPRETGTAAPVVTTSLSYEDASGQTRTFEVALRMPMDAPRPVPVVVYSHGGAYGVASARGVGTEWAEVFVSAGYAFVGIAHPERDDASRAALCAELGYDAAGCATFKWLSWDRPHDLRRTLDWLDEQAAGAYAGVLDPSHLAYAGHSAGAGGVLMAAGAAREFAGTLRTLSDPRPIAFIACSPEGPGMDGFTASSFGPVTGPILFLSGEGDDTEVLSESRREVFDLVTPGEVHLGWVREEGARHTTFAQATDGCLRQAAEAGIDPSRCDVYLTWLRSVALAFLDAELRGSAEARAYLASDAPVILSGGAMDWLHR